MLSFLLFSFSFLLFSFLTICCANLNQLSFSGGGSFGAVEIGILKRINQMDGNKKYNLYTGISAGALNSGFLSYYSDLNKGIFAAEKLYSNMRNFLVYELDPFTGISLLNTSKPPFVC